MGISAILTPSDSHARSLPGALPVSRAHVDGVTIAYQDQGPAEAETVLLIAGLGEQLTRWPAALIQDFLSRGYRVVCFDNRDAGLSSAFDTAETSDLRRIARSFAAGETIELPYSLDHMAQDALNLLDHIGVSRAHVIGVSLGAMVAQLAAAKRPDTVQSLTLIMTGTGEVAYLRPRPQLLLALMSLTASPNEEHQAVTRGLAFAQALAGPAFAVDVVETGARLIEDYRRAYRPFGVLRQLGAVLTQGDRRAELATIIAPTEIIHGSADPMLHPDGARQAAASIKHAQLTMIEGMGHDFAPALVATVIEAFCRAVAQAAEIAERDHS